MLVFKQFTPQAMAFLRPLLDFQNYRSNDYTLSPLYMWRDYYGQSFAVHGDMLIVRYTFEEGGVAYSVPVGPGSFEDALRAIADEAKEKGERLRFCCVPEEELGRLTDVFGRPSEISESRDWADYLYPYENFLGYHGKKLVTQRNHCNRFLRDNPDYEYKPLTPELVEDAKGFLMEHAEHFKKGIPVVEADFRGSLELLDYMHLFGFTGGLLYAGGRPVGMTIGEIQRDTLYVHVEKALSDVSGVYPMLASLYAKQNASPELKFINREDDAGDEGLRHSKLAYRPCALLKKYVVTF